MGNTMKKFTASLFGVADTAPEGNIGEDNKYVYDKNLKRWVIPGQPLPAPEPPPAKKEPAAPPPKMMAPPPMPSEPTAAVGGSAGLMQPRPVHASFSITFVKFSSLTIQFENILIFNFFLFADAVAAGGSGGGIRAELELRLHGLADRKGRN